MKILSILILVFVVTACKKEGGGTTSSNNGGLCSLSGGTNCPTPNPTQETAFSVSYVDPENGATGVGADEVISIQMNRAINVSSLIYNSGTPAMDNIVLRSDTGEEVNVTVNVQGDLLQVKPMFSLSPAKRYTFTMKTSVTDTNAKNLDREVSTTFTTAGQPGSNPGTNPMLSWSNEDNVSRNINVDRFEIHYGQSSRNNAGEEFLYQRVSEVPVSSAQHDPVTGKFTYELRDPLEKNRMYYYSLKACNSGGCSPYSGEVYKYQSGN